MGTLVSQRQEVESKVHIWLKILEFLFVHNNSWFFFQKNSNSKLASLFNMNADSGGNSGDLKYKAPKQPQQTVPTPVASQPTSSAKSSVIFFTNVQAFK